MNYTNNQALADLKAIFAQLEAILVDAAENGEPTEDHECAVIEAAILYGEIEDAIEQVSNDKVMLSRHMQNYIALNVYESKRVIADYSRLA